MLEVGCGKGELARALDAAGYDMMAIDPLAPDGAIFRRIKLEDLEEDEQFDAVVASRAFHHMPSLDLNLEHVARALAGGGPFIVDEFAWDRLDEPTADWYERQRRALEAAGTESRGVSVADWAAHHAGLTRSDELLAALRTHFEELAFERVPYLFRYLGGVASAELEETLVDAGAIQALGFRFVGMPREVPALKDV